MEAFQMPAGAEIVAYELRVADLEACLGLYTDVLGLEVQDRDEAGAVVGPSGRGFALRLVSDPSAPVRPQPTIGLYHAAFLVPDRESLGAVMRRVAESRWPWEGMADHHVSEALYLRDPESNGIELYRDRPRDEWPMLGVQVQMVSEPMDTDGVLGSASGPGPLHPDTRLGHVHLHVPDLEGAEAFYAGVLGLSVTQRTYVGALFCAAGDYHHHVGLNLWARGRTAPPSSTGLVSYEWRVPGPDLEALVRHLQAREVPFASTPEGVELTDPAGVTVVLDAA